MLLNYLQPVVRYRILDFKLDLSSIKYSKSEDGTIFYVTIGEPQRKISLNKNQMQGDNKTLGTSVKVNCLYYCLDK